MPIRVWLSSIRLPHRKQKNWRNLYANVPGGFFVEGLRKRLFDEDSFAKINQQDSAGSMVEWIDHDPEGEALYEEMALRVFNGHRDVGVASPGGGYRNFGCTGDHSGGF